MHRMTWNEVIERARKGRLGDLEIEKPDGSTQRGPIVTVQRGEAGTIVFQTIWMARRESRHDAWQSAHVSGVTVSDECQVNFDREGTIHFGHTAIGHLRVFQKHAGPLEPHEVYGLTQDEVRQSRAWMYDIPLDSDWDTIIDRVVDDLGKDGLVDVEDQLRVQYEAEAMDMERA